MFVFHGRVPVHVYILAFTALLSWTSFAVAGQRVPLTLAEAEDLALAEEPGYAALLDRADAMQEQAVAAGSLPDPMLRVGLANYPIDSGGFSTEGMTQAQLGIRQAFPRAREQGTEQFLAKADVFSERAGARGRDVLTAVRRAWLEVYYSEKAWILVNESRPFFADLVTITQSLYSVGRNSQHDVLRAELELSRLDDRIIETQRARAEAQAGLSRWIGQDAYRPIAHTLPNWSVLPGIEKLRDGLGAHPSLGAADADIEATRAGVRIAEERKKPGWALDFGYGYRDGYLPDGTSRSDFVSLSVTVDLPVFSERRQDRKLAAALSEQSAAIRSKTELQVRLASELDAEYARWSDLTRRLALYDSRILEQSKGQADAALRAYQSDAGDFADVMRSYIDDLNTRLEHTRLQVERARSYAVLANLGGIE